MAQGQKFKPPISRLSEFLSTIRSDLDRTVKFWLDHSIDEEYGGFFQCLDAEGGVYDTTKHCWFLARQVWTLARLYNQVARFRLDRLKEFATRGAEFVLKHVKNQQTNKCYLSLTREGKPIKIQRTIFSECFYVLAMSEMFRMTGEEKYKLEVMTPALTSQFAQLSQWCVDKVLTHVQRDRTVVLENVTEDGHELSGSASRLMNPGHAMESGWFLLNRAQKMGDGDKRSQLQKVATETFIMASFQKGWDPEFGGIFYFLDVDGRPPTQLEWDMKLWWVHNEALVASLTAFRHTSKPEFLDVFARVFDYVYAHFADEEHGEWFGYLSREGKVKLKAKGGPWKGCFHLPRCLMMCEQLLEEILEHQTATAP